MTITHHEHGGTTLTGNAISIYRALTVVTGLEWKAKGVTMQLTRGATPTFLMSLAAEITGKKFKSRDYAGAAVAVRQWITEAKVKEQHVGGEA